MAVMHSKWAKVYPRRDKYVVSPSESCIRSVPLFLIRLIRFPVNNNLFFEFILVVPYYMFRTGNP